MCHAFFTGSATPARVIFLQFVGEMGMGVTSVANVNADLGAEEGLDELLALARMIAYARQVAQDVKLQFATNCLDLALEAVKQEVGQGLTRDLAELSSSVPQVSVKRH
ncbi:hypothetical conserved protein [Rhizobium etli CIAT 652]|nr:hypothetical conserved protein [Rhizobium etli CIAT 652]